jgi:hypothetical protein
MNKNNFRKKFQQILVHHAGLKIGRFIGGISRIISVKGKSFLSSLQDGQG